MIGCLECGHGEHNHTVSSPHRCDARNCGCQGFQGPHGNKPNVDLWQRAEDAARELTSMLEALADQPSDFTQVGRFHAKFGLPVRNEATRPRPLDREAMRFRLHFLAEELEETARAAGFEAYVNIKDNNGPVNMPELADGLVDLVYVALGTAHMLNLPWFELFREVQRANMSKQRASTAADSKRGSSLDVVKPEGWKAPDIEGVLRRAGWRP